MKLESRYEERIRIPEDVRHGVVGGLLAFREQANTALRDHLDALAELPGVELAGDPVIEDVVDPYSLSHFRVLKATLLIDTELQPNATIIPVTS